MIFLSCCMLGSFIEESSIFILQIAWLPFHLSFAKWYLLCRILTTDIVLFKISQRFQILLIIHCVFLVLINELRTLYSGLKHYSVILRKNSIWFVSRRARCMSTSLFSDDLCGLKRFKVIFLNVKLKEIIVCSSYHSR
jgi:hypothetical protein